MEGLAALGLVSNVIGFITTGTTLYTLIKEWSSAAGAPNEVVAVSKRLELILKMLSDLDESGRAHLDHEKMALKICSEEAEKLRLFLEELKIRPGSGRGTEGGSKFKWLSKRRMSVEKGWRAFKTIRGREKLENFQTALNRILELIMMQQQSRVESNTLRVEDNTGILIQRSEQILKGLSELQLSASRNLTDVSAWQNKTIFMVPLGRNFGFVGREDIFAKLDLGLNTVRQSNKQKVRRSALYGLGGTGKSHIALEFSYRQKEKYPDSSIFWIHAATGPRFEECYKRIAEEFEIPGRNDPRTDGLQLVRNWFESCYKRSWVMIFDNVDDTQIFCKTRSGKSLLEYIPQVANGCILYTSRNRDICVDLVGDPINVPPMSDIEARMLLGDQTRKTSTDAEQSLLLEELDYLPLAITQAASYMTKRRKTIAQYLGLFQDGELSKQKLLSHKFADSGRESRPYDSVAATWIVTFKQVKLENLRAADILYYMSFLDRQSIPMSLLAADGENPVDFDEAIGILESYSLVYADETGSSYSVHRLVQAVTRAWLGDQEEGKSTDLASRVLHTLSARFPDGSFDNWAMCAQYLPHSEAILHNDFGDQSEVDMVARARLLSRVSWYLSEQGNFSLAKRRAEESLDIYRMTSKTESPEALRAKGKLASILVRNGDTKAGIAIYRDVLEAQESLLGKDHLDTLATVNDLGVALLTGDIYSEPYEEAEALIRRALAGRELALPTNDKLVLDSTDHVGMILLAQGKQNEAEPLLRKVATQREVMFGQFHPYTSTSIHNLAILIYKEGKYEEAEHLMRQSASIMERLLGIENSDTICVFSLLAFILSKLGKNEEAETIMRKQLDLSVKTLGSSHTITIDCLERFGRTLFEQGKYELAETLLREALSEQRELVEVTDGKIIPIMDLFADVLCDGKKYEEAQLWYKRALSGIEHICGENHRTTLPIMNALGTIFKKLKKYDESENYYRKALAGRQSVLGEDDEATLGSARGLANLLYEQDKNEEAEEIYRHVVTRKEIVLGKNHESTLLSADELGDCLCDEKKYEEAEVWYRRVLNGREDTLGETDPSTLEMMKDLAWILEKQDKNEEAEILCRRSLAIKLQTYDEDHPETQKAYKNLAYIITRQTDPDAAKALVSETGPTSTTLARACLDREDYENALVYLECAWDISLTSRGRYDEDTLDLRITIAFALEMQGEYEAAEKVYRETLAGREQVLGAHHEDTLLVASYLADALEKQGKFDEAVELRRRR